MCAATPSHLSDQQTPATAALEAQALSKTLEIGGQPLTILEPLDLRIETGESVAIVGTSGSGKSTLLGLLAGLDQPSAGQVLLQGQCITTMTEDERAKFRGQHLGFVFQSFQLMPHLTALENLMLPLELNAHPQAKALAQQYLAKVGLEQRAQHYPRQLSGGEQQRVALGRAFVTQPQLLLADEPTGNLDRATGERIENLLFELNEQQGTTLVLVTHDAKLANRCQRRLRIEAGILQNDTE